MPSRAKAVLDATVRAVEDQCGIASNLGKTRVIAAEAGPAPPGIAELGDDVWRGDKPDAQRGVVVLGSPLGHPAFVQAWAEERLRAEQELVDQLPKLPDLQCAWLLLLFCASPRANHAIRTMPPSASAAYARGHDDAIWTTLQNMLGGTGDADAAPARHVAALPGALGGLGLQSAATAAPAAYWASWADALPAIHARLPRCAVNYVQLLESEAGEGVHCLAEAAHARRMLQDQSWSDCPTWRMLLDGARPAPPVAPGARRLAAWLAVSRIADPYRTLSRSCASSLLAAQLTCPSPLPSGTACRSMAHCHTVRRGKPHPAPGDANRFEASLAPALASLLQPLRPQPRMRWRHGPLRRSCPRLPENRLVGQTCQSRRARLGPRGT